MLSGGMQRKVEEGDFEVVVLYRNRDNGLYYALTYWPKGRWQDRSVSERGGFFEGRTADEAVERGMDAVWHGL